MSDALTDADIVAGLREWAALCAENSATLMTSGLTLTNDDRRHEALLTAAADRIAGACPSRPVIEHMLGVLVADDATLDERRAAAATISEALWPTPPVDPEAPTHGD
jgi:hypothetical protein